MHPILLVSLSADGGFHFRATTSKAMNIYVQIFVLTSTSSPLSRCPRVGFQGHIELEHAEEMPKCFPKQLHHLHPGQQCMCILIFPFLATLVCLFYYNHSNGCEEASYCGSYLIVRFPND